MIPTSFPFLRKFHHALSKDQLSIHLKFGLSDLSFGLETCITPYVFRNLKNRTDSIANSRRIVLTH